MRACAWPTQAIRGAPLDLPGGEFAVGDRVVVKRNDRRLGVHNGQRGWIIGIDDRAGSLTLECREGVLTLDREFLLDTTRDGEPTLLHGYAITGHVAQGLTVDRSFVLASEGVSREWAYVALSRGRLSNRLYTAAVADQARVEVRACQSRSPRSDPAAGGGAAGE